MEFKVRHEEDQGREVEKWILRKAFSNWIPEEILNRPKLRFAGGTGVDDLMDELTTDLISDEEFKKNGKTDGGLKLNSPKELYYYQLFRNKYPRGYENLVIRWDPFK